MNNAKIFSLVFLVFFVVGCASVPNTSRTGKIHDIRIEDTISNADLKASIGDEIRWVNFRTEYVSIEFPPEVIHSIGCESGFSNLFGKLKEHTTLERGGAVSICFAKNGVYKYNVRMKASVPGGAIIVPSVITVGAIK